MAWIPCLAEEAGGIRSVAEKCIDITRTSVAKAAAGLQPRRGTKVGSEQIRYPGSPRRKRRIQGVS